MERPGSYSNKIQGELFVFFHRMKKIPFGSQNDSPELLWSKRMAKHSGDKEEQLDIDGTNCNELDL